MNLKKSISFLIVIACLGEVAFFQKVIYARVFLESDLYDTPSIIKTKELQIFNEDLAIKSVHSQSNRPIIPHGLSELFDISYLGAFRVESKGDSDSNYATGTLGYNEKSNSIFMAGKIGMSLAEFKIPNVLGFDPDVSRLPKASVLQEYVNLSDKRTEGDKPKKITGILYYKDNLIVNSNIWYDNTNTPDTTQLFRNPSNLRYSPFEGMLQLEGRAKAAGYMSFIPIDVQNDLGSNYLLGWSNVYSINNRYSIGPSLYTFNPQDILDAKVGVNKFIKTVAKQVYPLGNSVVDNSLNVSSKVSPIWGELAQGRYGFIVPNTRVFMVVGSHAGIHSGIGYKISQDGKGGPCSGYCTIDSADNYNYFWLYRIDDILNAQNVWDTKPFSYGKWSHPYDNEGRNKVLGATFDHKKNILYLSIRFAGRVGKYDRPPLIIAYELKAKS